jgi:putative addiction module CopG family antidote
LKFPPNLQQFVHDVINTGNYKSEADVVSQALRLLQQRQRKIEELRRDIQPALDELDCGEGIELKNEEELRLFFEDIKKRGWGTIGCGANAIMIPIQSINWTFVNWTFVNWTFANFSPRPLGEGQGVRAWESHIIWTSHYLLKSPHPNPLPVGEGTGN